MSSVGEDEVERLIVRRVRGGFDFADRKGDPDRANGAFGAQFRQRTVVMAGAEADAMAAPVEGGERREQQIWLHVQRFGRRLRDVHGATAEEIAGLPQPEAEPVTARDGDGQGGRKARRGERLQKRQRVRLVGQGIKGGDDARPPQQRQP